MPSLIECGSCHRHVRPADTSCPFCDLPLEAAPSRPPLVTARRVAAIAMSAAALGACGDDDLGNAQPVYGAPDPTTTTTTTTGGGAGGEAAGGSSAGGSAQGGSAQGGDGGTGGQGGA